MNALHLKLRTQGLAPMTLRNVFVGAPSSNELTTIFIRGDDPELGRISQAAATSKNVRTPG